MRLLKKVSTVSVADRAKTRALTMIYVREGAIQVLSRLVLCDIVVAIAKQVWQKVSSKKVTMERNDGPTNHFTFMLEAGLRLSLFIPSVHITIVLRHVRAARHITV